jgi:hypothetical protein
MKTRKQKKSDSFYGFLFYKDRITFVFTTTIILSLEIFFLYFQIKRNLVK